MGSNSVITTLRSFSSHQGETLLTVWAPEPPVLRTDFLPCELRLSAWRKPRAEAGAGVMEPSESRRQFRISHTGLSTAAPRCPRIRDRPCPRDPGCGDLSLPWTRHLCLPPTRLLSGETQQVWKGYNPFLVPSSVPED